MDKDAMSFEIPTEMRAVAERSVEQARIAFNTFMSAAQEAVTTFEGHAKAAQAGAKDMGEKRSAMPNVMSPTPSRSRTGWCTPRIVRNLFDCRPNISSRR